MGAVPKVKALFKVKRGDEKDMLARGKDIFWVLVMTRRFSTEVCLGFRVICSLRKNNKSYAEVCKQNAMRSDIPPIYSKMCMWVGR